MGNTQPHRGRRFNGRRGRGNQSGARGPGAGDPAGAAPPIVIPLSSATAPAPHRPTPDAGASLPPGGRRQRGANGRPPAPPASGRTGALPDTIRRRRNSAEPFERVVPVVAPERPARAGQPTPPTDAFDHQPRPHLNGAAERNGHSAPREAGSPATAPRSLADMRSMRAARLERAAERGEREPLRAEARGEVGPLIDDLHAVFEHDRAVASQGSNARCGICYLHFTHSDLLYREAEGFYVCDQCSQSLGASQVMMIRRQQK